MTKNRLPPRMVKRSWQTRNGFHTAYYYEYPRDAFNKRSLEALGTDFSIAKKKWGEIEGAKIEDFPTESLGDVYTRYMIWAENIKFSGLSPRTILDRKNYWKHLNPVFGHININEFKPEWFLKYFESRTSQVGAKKEIKFLSVLFNWAKLRGFCLIENPITGTTRQYKVKEHRDILITDEEYKAVRDKAVSFIQDLMDLLFFTAARPDEAITMKFSHVEGDALVYGQKKVGGRIKRVALGADLRTLIKNRKKILSETKVTLIDPPILFDTKGQPLTLNGSIKYWFRQARDEAKLERRWQLKDIRPYAATKRYKKEGIEATRKFLGHATESQTRGYIRDYLGEETHSHEHVNSKNGESNSEYGESS